MGRNQFALEGRTAGELPAVLAELRSSYGATAIGAQGFCWGGFFATHLTSLGDQVGAFCATHSRLGTLRVPKWLRPQWQEHPVPFLKGALPLISFILCS